MFGNSAGTSPEQIQKDLKDAVDDSSIKAILIRVNSPGGTPAASQEIYAEVKKAAKKKPVIASISDVGASGAYYAIAPSKHIVANPASMVGSIGVFMEIPIYKDLLNKLGVKFEIIKAGKYKALGDPSKDLTAEEKEILQKQVKIIYDQFVNDVAAARAKKITKKEVEDLATGLAFPGSEAKDLKLVDKLGDFRDAVMLAAKEGKIKGEPELVEYENPNFLNLFNGIGSSSSAGDILNGLFKNSIK